MQDGGKIKITLKEILKVIPKRSSLEEKVKNIEFSNPRKNNYYYQIEQFYKLYENKINEKDLLIAKIAKILAGNYREKNKRVWRWEDRINKVKDIYDAKKISHKKREVETLINILKKNRYLKNKYSDKLEVLNNVLLSYKNLDKYTKKRKTIFRRVLSYTLCTILATYLFLAPKIHKIYSKAYYPKNNISYVVKNGDNLWDITKNHLRNLKVKNINDKLIYNYCDLIAKFNGKGKQADYKVGLRDEKSPHYIEPNQVLNLPYLDN